MQTVSSAFTAEAENSVRNIAWNLQASWKKDNIGGNQTFTIGVSSIGGSDVVGINPGAVGGPGLWRYFDESNYVMELGWERSLNTPLGGLSKAGGEFLLDNTSGRFLPQYMGGSMAQSELFTSVGLPRRPFTISAGFDGETIPQFAGLTDKLPNVDVRNRTYAASGFDYVDYFADRSMDRNLMFTSQRTDQIIESLFNELGMSTSQYELDTGINTITYAYFESTDKFQDVINDLVQAENGHIFQDEEGKYHFWNRQHFTNAPYNQVQHILMTSQVINNETNSSDQLNNLINVVEVKSQYWTKHRPTLDNMYLLDVLNQIGQPVEIPANANTEVFINFENPVLEMLPISTYLINSAADGSGSDLTSDVSVVRSDLFSTAVKIVFNNTSGTKGYLTYLEINGRYIEAAAEIYVREEDSSSLTAYEAHPVTIENKYIQDDTWANDLATLLLSQYSEPGSVLQLTIRALPQLQLGDLISWQGDLWRIYGIKSRLSASNGFVQELTLSNSTTTTTSYFTIGISTIAGTDVIAP